MNFFQIESELISVNPDVIFRVGDWPVTNTMLSGLLITILIAVFAIWMKKSFVKDGVPGRFQSFVEFAYTALLDFVQKITGNRSVAIKIIPLVGGLFLYLVLGNIMLLIPGLSSILYDGVPVFRTHTNDFNTTFGIAIAMIVFTHILSIRKNNGWVHLNKFLRFNLIIDGFKQGIGPGILSFIDFFVGLLDIISEFAKSISLSLRLFGNIFAGEMLAVVIMGLFAIVAPIPIIFLSLFSGFIQALVFGALTASYLGIALADE